LPRKRTDAVELLRRLENGGLESLATLAIDHLLARPVAELVDPEWVARQVVLALDAVSAGPETEQWLAKRIEDLRETVPAGTVGDRMPDEIRRPLRDVVGRDYLPDRVLVGRLLDHAAMQRLLRDLLVGALRGFVAKLKAPVPRPLSKLRELGGKALQDGVLGGLSHEIERQAEARIKDFVDGAVHGFVEQVADHLTAPEHAAAYAAFRVHLVDTLVDTELAVFAGEFGKLQPEALVATGAATARALARREGFEGEIAAALRAAIDASSGRSLGELLAEAGIREDWRRETEAQLATQARNLVASDAFRRWLDGLVKPA
jgi:hypothetical protein